MTSHAFSVAVQNIWNKLPGDVPAVNSLPEVTEDRSFHCCFWRQV